MAQQGKDTNIMDLLQQFFQNNNTAANKKNENENYYLDHLQIPFTQQQSTSSSILLNHGNGLQLVPYAYHQLIFYMILF